MVGPLTKNYDGGLAARPLGNFGRGSEEETGLCRCMVNHENFSGHCHNTDVAGRKLFLGIHPLEDGMV